MSIKYIGDAPVQVPGHVKPEAPKNAIVALEKNTLSVTVNAQDLSTFSGRVLTDLLPNGEKAKERRAIAGYLRRENGLGPCCGPCQGEDEPFGTNAFIFAEFGTKRHIQRIVQSVRIARYWYENSVEGVHSECLRRGR